MYGRRRLGANPYGSGRRSARWRRATLLGCVAMLALGCDSKSPTAPPPPTGGPQGLNIVFAGGAGALAPREAIIREHLERAFSDAAAAIPVAGVTLSVSTDPARIISGWGVGGRTLSSTLVEIGIDPALPDSTLALRLPAIAAHELHHVARFRGPGYGNTLLEAMVSEGLADHFALERHSQPPPPWTMALSADQYSTWLARARLEFDSPGYNHAAWFFGSLQTPRWTGYTLGYRFVDDYKSRHGGASAASLVNTPAEQFRPH